MLWGISVPAEPAVPSHSTGPASEALGAQGAAGGAELYSRDPQEGVVVELLLQSGGHRGQVLVVSELGRNHRLVQHMETVPITELMENIRGRCLEAPRHGDKHLKHTDQLEGKQI